MSITFASPTSDSCEDFYGISTLNELHIVNAQKPETKTILWKGGLNATQLLWVEVCTCSCLIFFLFHGFAS